MERLTYRAKDHVRYAVSASPDDYLNAVVREAWLLNRLADYEDTGLEPEEVAALATERTCTAIEREGNFFTEGGEVDQEGFCQWLECSQCGRIIGRDARYCPGCGAKIEKEGHP